MSLKTENFLTKRTLINSSTYRDQIKVRFMMMADTVYNILSNTESVYIYKLFFDDGM